MRKNSSVEVICWRDIKHTVQTLAPDLYEGIESIDGVDQFSLVRARYPFGADIVKRGRFYVPVNGQSVDYDHPTIPLGLKSLLNYPWKVGPFGMVTHNTCEAFVELPSHVVPTICYAPGQLFSLLTLFEKKGLANIVENAYSVTSGSRSLLSLPKISHAKYNQRMAEFYDTQGGCCPQTFAEQWDLFHQIANSDRHDKIWYCEVIYFSKDFVSAIDSTLSYKSALASRSWQLSAFQHYQMAYDAIWAVFIDKHCPLAVKNNVTVMQTLNHLIKLCLGQATGFVPASTEIAAPIHMLTDALLNHYRIRYYWPIFMHVERCDFTRPIYHSLFKPCYLHPLSRPQKIPNTLPDIAMIKQVMDTFIDQVMNHKLYFSLHGTTLFDRLSTLEFDYFHPKGKQGIRRDIETLANEDPRFMSIPHSMKTDKSYEFPVHSDFFRGCIRIRPKAKKSV